MKLTLNKIREHSPCKTGWEELLRSKNKTQADDEEFSILDVLESNGLDDALWCLRCVTGYDREIRLFVVWCARQVEHLNPDPRVKHWNDIAEQFANGLATQDQLHAAWDASWNATMYATRNAAWATRNDAWNAARASACAYAWAADPAAEVSAWDAARAAQKEAFIKMVKECEK